MKRSIVFALAPRPIPPRDINIQLAMSEALKRAIKEPNDRPNLWPSVSP